MHLLFDLDGTLTNSRPGVINSIQHSLAENGLPVPEEEDLLWCIGPPILESFKKLVADAPELFEPAVRSYREHDIIGAKANSVTSIGVLWGYGTGAELMGAGATLCARVPRLLPELITSLC